MCAARKEVRLAQLQLQDTELELNSQHNLVVVYPTKRPTTETAPALSPLQAAAEARLAPHAVSQQVLDTGGIEQPQLSHFYEPAIAAEHVDVQFYNNVIHLLLCGMIRANLLRVCTTNYSCIAAEVCRGVALRESCALDDTDTCVCTLSEHT